MFATVDIGQSGVDHLAAFLDDLTVAGTYRGFHKLAPDCGGDPLI